MSVPVVVATAQWDSANVAVTQAKATMPASVVAGQLLLVYFSRVNQNGVGTASTGWTQLGSAATGGAGNFDACWFWKIADGTETGDVNLTLLGSSDKCGSQTYQITNWNNGANPVAGTWSTPSSSLAPDPPSLTSGFGAVDTLWIEASAIVTAARTFTPSTSYTNALTASGTNVGALTYATARRTTTAATENPAAVGWSGTAGQSTAMVVAVSGVTDKAGTAESYSFTDTSSDRQFTTPDDPWALTDTSTDREFVTFNDPWSVDDEIGDKTFSSVGDSFGVVDLFFGEEAMTTDSFTFTEGVAQVEVGWHTGHLYVSKFDPGDPQYVIENEVLEYNQIADGDRVNVVVIDGNTDSWTQYDRPDLVVRDRAINLYLDLPELKTSGEVRQRALDEINQSAKANSPGGTAVWQPWYTVKDAIWWVDENGQKYTATLEGLQVEFDMGTRPFQRASIDTGNTIICDEDTSDVVYFARDRFERTTADGLGDALDGGTWVTY